MMSLCPSALPKKWNFWIRIRMWEWLVLGMNDSLAQKLRKEHIEVVVNETKHTMHGFDMKNGKITQKIVNDRMELIKKI